MGFLPYLLVPMISSVSSICLLAVLSTPGDTALRNENGHLLLTDEGMIDSEIAERVGMHRRGVEEVRQRFVEDGFEVT
jgi:hypothetical protein